jgi:hypothetical protein
VLLVLLFLAFLVLAVVGFVVSVDWAAFAAANRPGTATALSIIETIIFFIFISPFVLAALAASSSTLRESPLVRHHLQSVTSIPRIRDDTEQSLMKNS